LLHDRFPVAIVSVSKCDASDAFLEWAWCPLQNAGQRAFVLVISEGFERSMAPGGGLQLPNSVGKRRLIR
jgi:hypothetical protein